ncbi:hypothetical protein, partial [Frankia sp. EI5c]|uniref:hypothetical protein n=1 Tax=Frankia sp. EI5c TaxID=683316 RepID=UPI0037C037C9
MTSFGGWLREAGRWRRPRPSPAACDTSGAPPRLSLAFTSANSFNALRLTFASTVLAVHAVAFGGFSDRP